MRDACETPPTVSDQANEALPRARPATISRFGVRTLHSMHSRQCPSADRCRTRSEALLDELVRVGWLAIALALLALRELRLDARGFFVRNFLQQVRDDVEPHALLVLRARDVRRRP